MRMRHIHSDIFSTDVTAHRLINSNSPDVPCQCTVICRWSGSESRAIDHVSYHSDYLLAQAVIVEEASCWTVPVAERRLGWPAMLMICPVRRAGSEWASVIFHDDVDDEHDHWLNGRDRVLGSLSSFEMGGDANA